MTTLPRSPDEVVKTASLRHPAGDHMIKAMSSGGTGALRRYVRALSDVSVPLPYDLRIEEAVAGARIRHRWVDGSTLIDLPGFRTGEFINAVTRIADWVRVLEPTEARLDTNLANFVISSDGRLVCVDVLPPLLVSLRPPEPGPWERVIGGLCFDADVTLCALGGYAARHLLRVLGPGAPRSAYGSAVTSFCPGHTDPASLAAAWFHTRLLAAEMALKGLAPEQQALDFFAATSVRALHATPAPARQARVDAVLSRAGGLSERENP